MTTAETHSTSEYEALLRADFASFAQHCFHELNLRALFAASSYHDIIAAKFEAVRTGRGRRVIINKPYDLDNIAFIFHPAVPGRARCVSAWHQGGMSMQCSGRPEWRWEVSEANAWLRSLL